MAKGDIWLMLTEGFASRPDEPRYKVYSLCQYGKAFRIILGVVPIGEQAIWLMGSSSICE